MESLRTHDSSLPISSKIDCLLNEFSGELTLLKSIPPGIDETDYDFEEDIRLIEKLLYDNSSSRPPEEFVSANSDAASESFSPSHILVKDSDSLMEEINLFCTPDYPMSPGIMFGVHDLDGDEVFVDVTTGENVEHDATVAKKEVNIAEPKKPMKKKDQIALDEEVARKLEAKMKAEMDEEERIAREKNEANIAYFAAKRAKEIRNKPPTKAQQKSLMCTYMKNMEGYKQKDFKGKRFDDIKKMFDKVYKRVNTFVDMNTEIMEEILKKTQAEVQAKVADDDTVELKRCLEIVPEDDDDDVEIKTTPLSSKSPTINFNREDLEVLRSIVKERFKKTKLVDDMDNLLFQTLKTMFKDHVEDIILKYQQGAVKVHNWKLLDSCGVHCVTTKNMVYYLLVEKMYLFTNNILHQLWKDVRLHVDIEVEMAYDLIRLIRRQINKGYKPE
nr:hypothetical protein [Tanacetum cinerariifolium]